MLDLQTKHQHGDSSMLQLRLAPALEVLDASVGREPGLLVWSGWDLYLIKTPSMRSFIMLLSILVHQCTKRPCGVPETNRILNAELVLEGPQRRGRVVGPILGHMACLQNHKSQE